VVTPAQAGRKAAAAHVPVFSVGVGDPRSRGTSTSGTCARRRSCSRRTTRRSSSPCHAKGFEDRRVRIEMFQKDSSTGRTRPLTATPPTWSSRAATRSSRSRCPTGSSSPDRHGADRRARAARGEDPERQPRRAHARVIDRKIKVLYVEDTPRWEFLYLSNALIRDRETILAHTLLVDADRRPRRRRPAPRTGRPDASLGSPPARSSSSTTSSSWATWTGTAHPRPGRGEGAAGAREPARLRGEGRRPHPALGVRNNPTRTRTPSCRASCRSSWTAPPSARTADRHGRGLQPGRHPEGADSR